MGQLPLPPDRSALPLRWGWANWERAEASRKEWSEDIPDSLKAPMWGRFLQITVKEDQGGRLHHLKCYYDGPIGFAKVREPSPGLRAMFFRDGNDRYVTHFNDKADEDHQRDKTLALQARAEHFKRKEEAAKKFQGGTDRGRSR